MARPLSMSTLKTGGFSLDLDDLKAGTPGITPAFGESLTEAASICLEEQGHSSPTTMEVYVNATYQANVSWGATNEQMRRCWNENDEATEFGACCIAALILPNTRNLHVIERSKKGTGFDYWLGSKGDPDQLFQNRTRLEVSGIRRGSSATVSRRITKKRKQIKNPGVELPAIVVVVEFGTPQARIVE